MPKGIFAGNSCGDCGPRFWIKFLGFCQLILNVIGLFHLTARLDTQANLRQELDDEQTTIDDDEKRSTMDSLDILSVVLVSFSTCISILGGLYLIVLTQLFDYKTESEIESYMKTWTLTALLCCVSLTIYPLIDPHLFNTNLAFLCLILYGFEFWSAKLLLEEIRTKQSNLSEPINCGTRLLPLIPLTNKYSPIIVTCTV